MAETDALFEAMLNSTGDAVMITDDGGRIERVNRAFERMTGYRDSDLNGQDARDLFKDFNDEEFCESLWTDADEPMHFDSVRSKHADGKVQLHTLTMSPVRENGGDAKQFLALILSSTFQTDAESDSGGMRVGYDTLTGLPDRSLLSED